ncbi:hypothetical protein RUM44_005172 [Polyplax serrata]|uniref:Ubiquitin-like domain-containing protein n=1 Tax=Polyplax serrata TaxID=468196 RepID=A0ABR1AEA6_POLSC
MTLIEGIGDEVTQFFFLIAILVIITVAWWSANVPERPLMRTVLILERRTTRHASYSQSPMVDLREPNEMPSQANETEEVRKPSESENDTTNSPLEVNVTEDVDSMPTNRDDIDTSAVHAELRPCEESQGDMPGEKNCSTSTDTVIKRTDNGCVQSKPEEVCQANDHSQNVTEKDSASGECHSNSETEGSIRIKLKYLNDDQKLVEGKLQEQLGDFKRRHFNLELSGRKLVRLIFNGKVLQQDSKTLQNYGFFDNCVVHCLVHQPRTPPPSPNLNRPREGHIHNETPNHQWDLGNILFASLSIALGLAWYGRYQYAQLYTATTTVALIGLTGMFTVSLIGMYIPDVDGIRT